MIAVLAYLAIFLPLCSALLLGFLATRGGKRILSDHQAGLIGAGLVSFAALCAVILLGHWMLVKPAAQILPLIKFLDIFSLKASWAISLDALSLTMLVVVLVVSLVVHIYSLGYMHDDASLPRFLSYLSLFTFAMLMLVTSSNLIQMFFGWEGVGLCSYLLIGYYNDKDSANAASIKAFVTNRVGDLGFALGIFAFAVIFGTVDFAPAFEKIKTMDVGVISIWGHNFSALTFVCLLLFVGAMGKSAQLFLHVWLPDAMEGPTPVSALIHAATMVTAGVFMLVRLSPLFETSPEALMVVTIVGATTALFAATAGLVQNDIKRIIAYSTCSQLGYMFFAIGVSAYSAAMFHLFTHAFFKALLFLGAGSVIHGLHGEQDIQKMGGLHKILPWTHALMLLGGLALSGIPPFAGFFSKDIILESAFATHSSWGTYAYVLGVLVAFMTAFYSFRLHFSVFFGSYRGLPHILTKAHESPMIMLVPLGVLALGAVFAGLAMNGFFVGMAQNDNPFWAGAIFEKLRHGHDILHAAHQVPGWVKYLPLGLGLLGIALAYVFYVLAPKIPEFMAKLFKPIYVLFYNKWYIDEIYEIIFVRPLRFLGQVFWQKGDVGIIDRLGPNGLSWLTARASQLWLRIHAGAFYLYAFAFVLALAALLAIIIIKMIG